MADSAALTWLEIVATTSRGALAEAVLEAHGAQAVTVLDDSDDITVAHVANAHPDFAQARVVGLFDAATHTAPIVAALRAALGDAAIATRTLKNRDWNSAWMAQHPPRRFGPRLWVAHHGARLAADDTAVIVRLDPGLAFGTGAHASTALCLKWLAAHEPAGLRVLDYGCGSGILAIAAARLGAAAVTAIDNDDQAVRAARDNAAHNGVAGLIRVGAPAALGDSVFDIVLANILAAPLIAVAPALTRCAAPGAALVLAGVLARQARDVKNAYARAFTFGPGAADGDWLRLDARRDGPRARRAFAGRG